MTKEYNPAQIFSLQNNLKVRCRQTCKEHLFCISKCSRSLVNRTRVEMRLCPYLDKSRSIVENVWPEANFDGKHYLPSFMMGIDKVPIQLSQSDYLESFSKKLEDSLKNSQEIWEPQPGLDKKKCGVCGITFKDYQKHIKSRTHKLKIKKSAFQRDIQELSSFYSESLKNFEIQNDASFPRRLRSFKKTSKYDNSNVGLKPRRSLRIEKSSQEEIQQTVQTQETKGKQIDHQLETMTLKKSEQKTNLNPNSIC